MNLACRVGLIVAALVCASCDQRTRSAKLDSGFEETPNTAGVEGHGGIAISGDPGAVGGGRELAAKPPVAPAVREVGAPDASSRTAQERSPEDLYIEAYALHEWDPKAAERGFKRVMELTEPGSPLHVKAARQLSTLKDDKVGE